MVLENQRDCGGVAAVTGYRSASNGPVDFRLLEAERLSLRSPIEGQPGDLHELGRGEAEGLASVEDGFGDLGAQKGPLVRQKATFRLRVRPCLRRDFGRLLWLVFLNDQASRGISLDLVTAFANAKAKCCFWTNAVAPDIVQV